MASFQTTSLRAIAARLLWMMAGPAILLLLGLWLATNSDVWLSRSSIAFLVLLGAVVLARWCDPYTAEGTPVSTKQLRRYTVGALGIGLAGWAAANWLDM